MAEIIAEVGNVHEGSLGIAMSLVTMLSKQGVKVVKFQMHIADQEGLADEPFRVNFSNQDQSRQDYWRRVNFTIDQWVKLAQHCSDLNVEFLCTPFSKRAAQLLHENRLVKRWKVGSGDATNLELLDYLASTELPIILSTGLVSNAEMDYIVEYLRDRNSFKKLTLLHCVSKYPTNLANVDLHLMKELEKYGCDVGFSDHTGSLSAAIYALSLGAKIVEVHTTPHREFFGPDVSSSLLPEQIGFLVSLSQDFEVMKTSSSSKGEHFNSVSELRNIFRKGLYWKTNLNSGHKVEFHDLLFLKPVKGVDGIDALEIVGKTLIEQVEQNTPVLRDQMRDDVELI